MRCWVWALAVLCSVSGLVWAEKPAVVLVPGFFNSLADGSSQGPYFSRTVVETIRAQGHRVYVVNNLLPVGTVEANAQRLLVYLQRLENIPGWDPLESTCRHASLSIL